MLAQEQYLGLMARVEDNLRKFLFAQDERYIRNLMENRGKTEAQARSLACWDWTHGVGLYGLFKRYQYTKDETILDYLESWYADRMAIGLPEKNVNTVCPLLTMAFLHQLRPKPVYAETMQEWAQWIIHEMPRTEEGGIQHTHSELENLQELWDDTLLMTVLFLGKYGMMTGQKDCVDEAEYQFLLHAKYLIDRKTKLWYHGYTFLERNHFAGALWGRGNCWVTVFIPDFLEIVTLAAPIRRYALNVLEGQAKALRQFQAEGGMWHTLINDPGSYLEASGTAGFCYGILKGIRKKYLSESEYMPCAKRALKAICQSINDEGELMQVSYGTNVGRTLEEYREIPLTKMHYGQSLAMMVLLESLENKLV